MILYGPVGKFLGGYGWTMMVKSVGELLWPAINGIWVKSRKKKQRGLMCCVLQECVDSEYWLIFIGFLSRRKGRKLMAEINTGNDQMVGVRGDQVVMSLLKNQMSKEEALRHAAWLVMMAGCIPDDTPTFDEILEAVQST